MNKDNNINVSVNMAASDHSAEIADIVRNNLSPGKMREEICRYHEKDIAYALDMLTDDECRKIFLVLPSENIANIIEYLENKAHYFDLLSLRRKTEVLTYMEAPEAVELLKELSKEERSSMLDLMRPDVRADIQLISSFDDDEIGSRMSANFISVSENASIKEAMSELISQAAENDNISVIYVTNSENVFCGAIDLKDLIIARDSDELSGITMFSYPYLYANADIEECIPFLREYSEESIPVLDNDNRLIGVVTAHDLIEILDDELSDDYAKLGGLSSEEDLAEPVSRSVKKRMPWLLILMVLGLGVSATVGLFESVVAQLPVIMCFQSLVLDMAGNVGTQSLAVAIRVLMDSNIGRRQKLSLVWKEMRVGMLNGVILGALSFIAIGGYLCVKGNAAAFSFAVSGCLGAAMMLAMVASSLSGTVIPVFFKKIGIDPAVASGPLITTVNDLVAVIAYYGLSWVVLLNMMNMA